MIVVAEPDGSQVAIYVDSGAPKAWREQPFFSDLKRWATAAVRLNMQIVVCEGSRKIVILPDREIDLGPVADDERIVTFQVTSPTGVNLRVLKLHKDDPRAAAALPSSKIQMPLGPLRNVGSL